MKFTKEARIPTGCPAQGASVVPSSVAKKVLGMAAWHLVKLSQVHVHQGYPRMFSKYDV